MKAFVEKVSARASVQASWGLAPDEGASVGVLRQTAPGPVVLVCEHASHRLPAHVGDLGLPALALQSHIAWDPGAFEVAKRLSDILVAPLVFGRFSRLIYDCNRDPSAADAIVQRSEQWEVPGNTGITTHESDARASEIYFPFFTRLDQEIRECLAGGIKPVLITIHSFTPVYNGVKRDVEIGVLHDKDTRFADVFLQEMPKVTDLSCARNQPYGPADGVTHTLRQHALPHGLANVMIEIRSDLIASEQSQERMATYLAEAIGRSLEVLGRPVRQSAGEEEKKPC